MEKINVAELLKDCPSGMELDCTIFDGVVFHDVVDRHFPIRVRREQGGLIELTANGCIKDKIDAKCVIFPKGKTTWEGFVPPCKFKVEDKITDKNKFIYRITEITDKGYKLHDLTTTFITFEEADLHFVKAVDIFDINTLKPFDKVLVRDVDRQIWIADFFSHIVKEPFGGYRFACIGHYWHQCIPYEGNEHLIGTTESCNEYFKTWA